MCEVSQGVHGNTEWLSLPLLGDVLQLPLPVCGAVLFPGPRLDAEGSSGRHRSHVHPQGERKPASIFSEKQENVHCICCPFGIWGRKCQIFVETRENTHSLLLEEI